MKNHKHLKEVPDLLKELIERMLHIQPEHRLSIKGVFNHPWMAESCASGEEVRAELAKRKIQIVSS
jgi:hypothetical protein